MGEPTSGLAVRVIDSIRQDARYAVRLLYRAPLFTLTATLSLAIGIGADTAIFTIANQLLFHKPAGVVEPDRLVDIGWAEARRGGFNSLSYPNYQDLGRTASTLQEVYAYQLVSEPVSLGRTEGAERILGNVVSANYFSALGVQAFRGRLFGTADADAPVAVVSHGLWTRRFDRSATAVGSSIVLNGQPFTVVGVAPEGFHGTSLVLTDVWLPAMALAQLLPNGTEMLRNRASPWLTVGGRLKPGVTVSQAAAEITAIGRQLAQEFPTENRDRGLRLVASSPVPGNILPLTGFLGLLMGAVFLVLLIACMNVAGVLLSRANARRREIAIRVAVGAGRGRLIRQLLTEVLLLLVLGCAAGIAMARLMTSLLLRLLPSLPFPIDLSLPLDARVIAFAIGLSLVAALLAGLAPAIQAARTDVVGNLKEGSDLVAGRLPLRSAFVVIQVALSLVLIIGAGLLARALQKASNYDFGFDPNGVELASVDLSLAGYTAESGPGIFDDLRNRMRRIGGVSSASLVAAVPMNERLRLGALNIPGVTGESGDPSLAVDWNLIAPEYFVTMKVPLVTGRDFTDADLRGATDVAIVDETLVARYFAGQQPLGRFIQLVPGRPGDVPTPRTLQIVGVVRALTTEHVDGPSQPTVYLPLAQHYTPRATLLARTTQGQRVTEQVRTMVAAINPNLPILSARTLGDVTDLAFVPQRVSAWVAGTLGVLDLLLAAIGLYGVAAHGVALRTREIGVRLALGANARNIVGIVLRQGLSLVGIGVFVGILLASVAVQSLSTLLFGIPPLDVATFAGAAALFVLTGILACLVPVRRALRIEAAQALRME